MQGESIGKYEVLVRNRMAVYVPPGVDPRLECRNQLSGEVIARDHSDAQGHMLGLKRREQRLNELVRTIDQSRVVVGDGDPRRVAHESAHVRRRVHRQIMPPSIGPGVPVTSVETPVARLLA